MSKFLYNPDNYDRNTNTPELFDTIARTVSTTIKRNITENELRQIKNFIDKVDPVLIQRNKQNTINIMVKNIVSEFSKFDKFGKCINSDIVDTHVLLNDTIGISSESSTAHGIYDDPNFYKQVEDKKNTEKRINDKNQNSINEKKTYSISQTTINQSSLTDLLGIKTSEQMTRVLNPKSLYRKNYFILDSRYRSVNTSTNKLSWDFNLNTQPNDSNSVNIIGNLRDIIALKIYSFRLPYSKTLDNKYKRISILIDELSSQSFVAHEQRNFHFVLETDIDSSFINVNTLQFNEGYFRFEKPITTLDKITLSIANPLEPVYFDTDRCGYLVDNFSMTPLTKITTYLNNKLFINGLLPGDLVYFSNYETGKIDPVLVEETQIDNNIKNSINSINGFEISILDHYSFTINLDTALIQNPIEKVFYDVFFGSKRIFIPFEVEYIQPQLERAQL